MKQSLGLGLVVTSLLTVVGTRQAKASPDDDALDTIKEAIVAVDEEGGRCKKEVFDDLLDIRDLVRDGSNRKASKLLRSVRKNTDDCPRRVEKALRRVQAQLEGGGGGRRRDDDKPDAPKRPTNVPFSDWARSCVDEWLVVEMATGRSNQVEAFSTMFAPACTSTTGMPNASYPNGQLAASGDTWYYANGQMAKSGTTFYYPNGQMARSGSTWYYANGQMAVSGATWYYPNGSMAGAHAPLLSWACKAAGEKACKEYNYRAQSDLDEWRVMATITLAQQAR